MILSIDSEAWQVLSRAYVITNQCSKRWGAAWLAQSRWSDLYRAEISIWQSVCQRSLLDIFRAISIAEALRLTAHLDGDVAEFGVALGGTTAYLALLCDDSWFADRRVIAVDSFAGLPAPDRSMDRGYRSGQFATDASEVAAYFSHPPLSDRIHLVTSTFEACSGSLPNVLSLVHADGDLYEPTRTILSTVDGRMAAGGIVVMDDAWDDSGGVWAAAGQHLPATCDLRLGPTGQLLWFSAAPAGLSRHPAPPKPGPRELNVSTEWLERLEGYADFIRACRERSTDSEKRAIDDFCDLIGIARVQTSQVVISP